MVKPSSKTVKLAVFTDYRWTPSSRFRMRQYFQLLEASSLFTITEYPLSIGSEWFARTFCSGSRLRDSPLLFLCGLFLQFLQLVIRAISVIHANYLCDQFWISRELSIGWPSLLPLFLFKPCVYDIDDAVFLRNCFKRLDVYLLVKKASLVVTGNSYLSNYCLQIKPAKYVHILPTSVDAKKYLDCYRSQQARFSSALSIPDTRFIVWSGTSSSFPYLDPVLQDIYSFLLESSGRFKLVILSDSAPSVVNSWPDKIIKFVHWNDSVEQYYFSIASLGLMPLRNDAWCRGKCAYKLLTYACAGFPTLSSRVGVNAEILSRYPQLGNLVDSDWNQAIRSFFSFDWPYSPFELRQVIVEHFSVDSNYPELSRFLAEPLKKQTIN
jgi:hypothetical protein